MPADYKICRKREFSRSLLGIVLLWCLGWGSWPGVVGAESLSARDLSDIQRLGKARGHSQQDIESLVDRARHIEGSGLPHEPIVNKIKEGLAKGVPLSRISPVLRKMEGNLREAHDILAEHRGRDNRENTEDRRATEVLAEALGRGVTRDNVRALKESGRGGKRRLDSSSLAFGAKGLALTGEGGVSHQDGTPLVGEAIRQGFQPHELLDLGREMKKRGRELKQDRIRLKDIQKALARGERADRIFNDRRGRGSGRGGGNRDRDRFDDDNSGKGDRGDRSRGRDSRGDRIERSDRSGRGGGDDRSGRDSGRGRGRSGRDH